MVRAKNFLVDKYQKPFGEEQIAGGLAEKGGLEETKTPVANNDPVESEFEVSDEHETSACTVTDLESLKEETSAGLAKEPGTFDIAYSSGGKLIVVRTQNAYKTMLKKLAPADGVYTVRCVPKGGAAPEEKPKAPEETKETKAYSRVTIKKTPFMSNNICGGKTNKQWPTQEQLEKWLPK